MGEVREKGVTEKGSERRLRRKSNEGIKLLAMPLDQSIWLLNCMDAIQLMGKSKLLYLFLYPVNFQL